MKKITVTLGIILFNACISYLRADVLYLEEIKASEFSVGNTIEWSTLIEFDVSEFVIEKSTDGRNFFEIGNLEGSGYSLIDKKYHFIDINPIERKSYYRLREISKTGQVGYSLITILERKKVSTLQILAISSPEVASKFTITVDALEAAIAIDIKIKNSKQQIVQERTENLVAGVNYVSLDFDNMDKGEYQVFIRGKEIAKKFKITKTTNKKSIQVPVASSLQLQKN